MGTFVPAIKDESRNPQACCLDAEELHLTSEVRSCAKLIAALIE